MLKEHASCRHSGNIQLKNLAPSGEILPEEQDLPGIAGRVNPSPAMIFLPPGDVSRITGCLDPVASLAEDLEIIPGPLVTPHGNWPDVVQDIMMAGMRTSVGPALMDLAFAPGTPPSLFVPDKPPHSGDRRPFFVPVFHIAGWLTAEGMLVSRIEVHSLAAAPGTGTPGDPLPLFRSILAIFTYYHIRSHLTDAVDIMTHILWPVQIMQGQGG